MKLPEPVAPIRLRRAGFASVAVLLGGSMIALSGAMVTWPRSILAIGAGVALLVSLGHHRPGAGTLAAGLSIVLAALAYAEGYPPSWFAPVLGVLVFGYLLALDLLATPPREGFFRWFRDHIPILVGIVGITALASVVSSLPSFPTPWIAFAGLAAVAGAILIAVPARHGGKPRGL